ncbi:MAG TPA: alpha-1,2-fucosyltransferase [Puia sp.]
MSIVICQLPAAGLGNQLFPLVKAAVFAELNGLPMVVAGYNQFRIGPYLRGEKIKRNYNGYFTFQKGWIAGQVSRLAMMKYNRLEAVNEPPLERLGPSSITGKKFVFNSIPHWSDYFAGLKEHRELAISLLKSIIRENIVRQVDKNTHPSIGIHIRMGDFRKLQTGEDFSKVGAVRTPEDYFIDIISSIRRINGQELPVSVFTDGYRHEFKTLFDMPQVRMVEGNPDIVDMLLLGKSKLIVTSAGSTFSYWSGFLSDATVIMHPDHLHEPIRPDSVNRNYYEGPFLPSAPGSLLERNIKQLLYE